MAMEFLRYLGIAFISSALLIVLSKIVMQAILRRPADYYLREEYRQEERILNAGGFSITDEIVTTPEGELTEEHLHVEPQIPETGPEPLPGPLPVFVPEPVPIPLPVSGTEPVPIPLPVTGTEPVPEPQPVSGPEPVQEPQPETETIPEGVPLTKEGKPRKPSKSMRKSELIAIAQWKGIELPADATKAVILEHINNAK